MQRPDTVRMNLFLVCFFMLQVFEAHSLSCSDPREIDNAFVTCSKGNEHLSVCKIQCKKGYELQGSSRTICWCRNGECAWKGDEASYCTYNACDMPVLDSGRVHLAAKWPRGFGGVVEFDDIPLSITQGWSIVVVFDKPLGTNVSVTSWNMELSSTSYDRQTFTFVNTRYNSDLSRLTSSEFSGLFVMDYLETDAPRAAYAGMYTRRVRDASCVSAPQMHDLSTMKSRGGTSTKYEPDATEYTMNTRTEQKVSTTAYRTVKTTRATTTRTTTPKTTDAPPTTLTTKAIPPNGRYCILQRATNAFQIAKMWIDDGEPYFDAKTILESSGYLGDWTMVLVFTEKIVSIKVWSARLIDSTDDGIIWTFGPLSWNEGLEPGTTRINIIGKRTENSASLPQAQIFLCSNSFTSGDALIMNVKETTTSPTITEKSTTFTMKPPTPATTHTTSAKSL